MMADDEDDFYNSGNVRDMIGHNGGPELDDDDAAGAAVYNAKIAELMLLTPEELIKRADKRLLVDLVAKMEAGYASHQELSILNMYLKNKGMVFPPSDGVNGNVGPSGTQEAKAPLPAFTEPEYAEEDD